MSLTIESGPEAPGQCRRHLRTIGSYLGPRYDDVALVLTELVTNSVRHAAGDEPIDIDVVIDGDIRIEVADSGSGFDPDPRTRSTSSLGLTIVEQLAADWGTARNHRFKVWVVLSADASS